MKAGSEEKSGARPLGFDTLVVGMQGCLNGECGMMDVDARLRNGQTEMQMDRGGVSGEKDWVRG